MFPENQYGTVTKWRSICARVQAHALKHAPFLAGEPAFGPTLLTWHRSSRLRGFAVSKGAHRTEGCMEPGAATIQPHLRLP